MIVEEIKKNPRAEINKLIKNKELEKLLLKTGELHGHFCPYVSLGVMAGVYCLNYLQVLTDGMEDVLAVVETNSCFSDGVQYVTGCTFGNNGLIYKDYGKTAVTVVRRGDKGIRLHVKERDNILARYPEAQALFEKIVVNREGTDKEKGLLKQKWTEIAFDLLKLPEKELFDMKEVYPDLPGYAPIFADEYCCKCGEKIMAPKAVKDGDKVLCKNCAGVEYLQLDGSGLKEVSFN